MGHARGAWEVRVDGPAHDAAGDSSAVLGRARRLAADVLVPAAMAVDSSHQIPPAHLALLAARIWWAGRGFPHRVPGHRGTGGRVPVDHVRVDAASWRGACGGGHHEWSATPEMAGTAVRRAAPGRRGIGWHPARSAPVAR